MDAADVPNSVKEARERFDLFSDASLASRLQDQEFGAHFHANRQERRLVGSDTKVSRVEQLNEMERQAAIRRAELNKVAETDEEIARRLQEEFNREEEVKRFLSQKQAEEDAKIARELQQQEQGRIVGYGPSTVTPASSSSTGTSSARRASNPHHVYAAQNDLNAHYASRVSTSLIDLSAEDALDSLPSPPIFHPSTTNIDPFLTPNESRVAAYAPSDVVPLLPPPPESVVRREQERVMEELNRLQPRLAMAGLALGSTVVPVASTVVPVASTVSAPVVSPPPAYVAPPLYAPAAAAAAPLYPPVPHSTGAAVATSPPLYSPPPPGPAATPAVTVSTATPVTTLAASNPFLVDLMGDEMREGLPYSPQAPARNEGRGYFSEFGLPPPSSLATGAQREPHSQSLI